MYQVQKKDGTIEDFDRSKIVTGIMKAGGSAEDAEKVAQEIEAWLPTAAVNNIVKTTDIRAKGLEVLWQVNPAVAARFESYKKQ